MQPTPVSAIIASYCTYDTLFNWSRVCKGIRDSIPKDMFKRAYLALCDNCCSPSLEKVTDKMLKDMNAVLLQKYKPCDIESYTRRKANFSMHGTRCGKCTYCIQRVKWDMFKPNLMFSPISYAGSVSSLFDRAINEAPTSHAMYQ
jgi:hypothetical protein